MSRVSTAAAIEIQSCFRIVLAKKAANILNSKHEEKCNLSATRIQSLVRLNIAKSRFERIVSLVTRIQSLVRVNIAKSRFERNVSLVTKLQSLARLNIAKSRFQRSVSLVTRIQSLARSNIAKSRFQSNVSLVTRIQSLVRLNIAKSRFQRNVSLAITIQCFFRVTIAKKRIKELIQIQYNSNKKEQLFWARCSNLLVLVGVVMVVLCFFRENRIIRFIDNGNENNNDISIITNQTKDENSLSPVEFTKGALNVELFRSGVGFMDDLSEITQMLSKHNHSDIIHNVLSEEWRQRETIQAEEENEMDNLVQNVMRISQGMVEIETPMKEAVVEASMEYNISIDDKEDFTESQLILSRWKDISTRDETVSFVSVGGKNKDYLTVLPGITEECAGKNDENLDHLEIVKEFAKQFGMEHILSVQNFDSVYI